MSKPLPILILDKNDFTMSINIHKKRWRCIDVSPVRGMPKGFLVVRLTYQTSTKFTIVVYKVHELLTTTKEITFEFEILRKLLKYEFNKVAKLYPINFILPYNKLIKQASIDKLADQERSIGCKR
ncbi:hypothetical protein EZMO1_2507 [Endozoicomonas montiporae CL-33]|uniref:Uncharacterized protein n=1 Tax=Endozoicomonas montiporae CL-33 TaxID=570277 RepID=A0A142BCW3_9GAMM|nr:hypothetical protein [Endozoicomonas montiporae]AMO56589.1 hypothetical protein EZMO1_2507 [Endozoicomonas montiporae CL-33]